MDKPLLDDKNQHPTEAIIFPLIGRSKAGWRALFDHLGDAHPDFESTWRFYKDGGRWLLKTTRKSKTIFWLSVMPKHFVVTFYFGDKAEPAILESALCRPAEGRLPQRQALRQSARAQHRSPEEERRRRHPDADRDQAARQITLRGRKSELGEPQVATQVLVEYTDQPAGAAGERFHDRRPIRA